MRLYSAWLVGTFRNIAKMVSIDNDAVAIPCGNLKGESFQSAWLANTTSRGDNKFVLIDNMGKCKSFLGASNEMVDHLISLRNSATEDLMRQAHQQIDPLTGEATEERRTSKTRSSSPIRSFSM